MSNSKLAVKELVQAVLEAEDELAEDLKLGDSDHKVLAAFSNKQSASSKKFSTDGEHLHGHWMGGSTIASWKGDKVHLRPTSSRSEQTVHNALKKRHLAKNDIHDQ
jgi:hypothetical protein